MKLAAFYAHIGPYLEGKVALVETTRALYGDQPPRDAHRLAIYERFCREHRNTATGGVHRELREVVTTQGGEAGWRQLVEDYFTQHPMQHVEINENGALLAAYLATRVDLPAMWSALADFEWWEWQTLIAHDDPMDAAPDAGPLRIASTVELRPYAWNFVDWLDAEEREAAPEPGDVLVLFWRNRRLDARRALATVEELQVLKQVSEGQPLEPSETLNDLHGAGILLGQVSLAPNRGEGRGEG